MRLYSKSGPPSTECLTEPCGHPAASPGVPAQAQSYRSRSGGCCAGPGIHLRRDDLAFPLNRAAIPRRQPVIRRTHTLTVAIRWMMCRAGHPLRCDDLACPPNRAALPRRQPEFRRGHSLTDRDQVDDVPRLASTSGATIPPDLPPRKNSDSRPLAGSGLSTKGLMHRAVRRPIRVRPPRSHPSSVADFRTPSVRKGCAATAGAASDGSCRRPEILGRSAAAGGGTAIQILRRRILGTRRESSSRHRST